ncbi:hypothetical protein ANO11243_070740 [Dothideomycetidae sp. 11243]|nr:hypothetical protein ANO11243_070740 [fungal sp. No.11243]
MSDQPSNYDAVKTAHASLAILAWTVFFPLGGIVIRVLSSPRAWLVHGLLQLFSYAMFTTAVGMGIWMTQNSHNVYLSLYFHVGVDGSADIDQEIGSYHPVIGLVVFALVSFEPIGGYVHHYFYKREDRRAVIAWTHVWLGRILITLGMINGGLGLLLSSDAERGEYIAYGVIAALIWISYMAFVALWHVRRPEPLVEK